MIDQTEPHSLPKETSVVVEHDDAAEISTRNKDFHSTLNNFRERTGFGKKLLNPNYGLGFFNVMVTVALFVFFVFNAVTITKAYRESLKNPPTTFSIEDHSKVVFPSILICNAGTNASLTYVFSMLFYANNSDTSTDDLVHPVAIDGSFCYWFDGPKLNGFQKIQGKQVPNELFLGFDVNLAEYTSDDPYFGVQMFLVYDFERRYGPYETTELSRDMADGILTAGSGQGISSSLSLTKYELYNTTSGAYNISYDFDIYSGNNPINPSFAQSIGFDPSAIVMVQFTYSKAIGRLITSAPQSFSTFFGSLAGWMGACSNGWGLLTVIFFLEKFFLRATGRTKEQLWYVPGNQELEKRIFG